MRSVRTGPVIGLIAELALLAALAATVGLSGSGWVVGVACAVVMNLVAGPGARPLRRPALGAGRPGDPGPATLVGGVAALVADSFARPAPVTALVGAHGRRACPRRGRRLGRAAHRNGVGARRALRHGGRRVSDPRPQRVRRAASIGAWVLAIGAARYVFVAARLAAAVAARAAAAAVLAQGRRGDPWRVLLTVGGGGRPARSWMAAALGVSLALLAESFGRDVWWLWRAPPAPRLESSPARDPAEGRRRRAHRRRGRRDSAGFPARVARAGRPQRVGSVSRPARSSASRSRVSSSSPLVVVLPGRAAGSWQGSPGSASACSPC